MAQQIIMNVKNISKSYTNKKAIQDISFTIHQGEVFGLLGPNGSGKTTTIRVVTGLTKPNHGSVNIFDIDINEDLIKYKHQVGFVPDSDDLLDDLTANEFLDFICSMRGLSLVDIRNKKAEWLKTMDLWEDRNKLLSTFSHGMRKKTQIVSALLHQPKLLIVDEPTSGLDPDMIVLFKKLLKNLKEKEITCFISTHNLGFAQEVCDNVFLIRKGKRIVHTDISNILTSTQSTSLEEAYMKYTEADDKGENVHAIFADW